MKNAGYLFCFFTGKEKNEKDEQVYFALSRDGITLGGFEWTKAPALF